MKLPCFDRTSRLTAVARATVLAAVAVAMVGTSAHAAELTQIVDQIPRDGDGAQINFELNVGFDMWSKSGLITREFKCISHDKDLQQFCPDGSQVLDRREMTYTQEWQQLTFSAKVGFWRIASIELVLPYVLKDQTKLDFDEGIDTTNSSVSPSGGAPQLFQLPFDGRSRGGVGDLEARIRFAPMSWSRDQTHPNWVVDINVVFPTSELKAVDNDAPGGGLWQVELGTAVSSRFMPWFEPYFRLAGNFRVTGADTFFQEFGNTQTLAAPGHQLKIALGMDLIPYENLGKEEFFAIDLRADILYQFEGREYTALYEGLGSSACDPGNDQAPCDLTTFTRGDIDPATGERRKTDGLTDIEQHALVRGMVGFRWQMWKHIQLRFLGWIGHQTGHFLTTADAGKDLDNQNQVEASNSQCVAGSPPLPQEQQGTTTCGCQSCVNEYNPVYNDAYDSLGTRFRSANTFLWGVNVSLIGKF